MNEKSHKYKVHNINKEDNGKDPKNSRRYRDINNQKKI